MSCPIRTCWPQCTGLDKILLVSFKVSFYLGSSDLAGCTSIALTHGGIWCFWHIGLSSAAGTVDGPVYVLHSANLYMLFISLARLTQGYKLPVIYKYKYLYKGACRSLYGQCIFSMKTAANTALADELIAATRSPQYAASAAGLQNTFNQTILPYETAYWNTTTQGNLLFLLYTFGSLYKADYPPGSLLITVIHFI